MLVPPALVTDDHYRSAFKILMALVALGGLWCVARLLVELGAGRLRLALASRVRRGQPTASGECVAQLVRRVAGGADGGSAAGTRDRCTCGRVRVSRAGVRCEGLRGGSRGAGRDLRGRPFGLAPARMVRSSVRRGDCCRGSALDRRVAGRRLVEHPVAARARPARGEPRRVRSTRRRPARLLRRDRHDGKHGGKVP